MVVRLLRILVPLVVALLAAALLAGYWVLRTESGAAWVLARAAAASGGRLRVAEVDGTLRGGLRLANVAWRDAGTEIAVDRLALRLNPDVLPLAVSLEDVTVDGARIRLPAPAAGAPATGEPVAVRDVLAALRMPVIVNVTGLIMRDVLVATAGSPDPLAIDSLSLDASLFDSLQVDRLHVTAFDATLDMRGALRLAPPYDLDLAADARLPLGEAARQSHVDVVLALGGNLSDVEVDLHSPTHGLRVDGHVAAPLDEPRVAVTVAAEEIAWPFDAREPALTATNLQATIQGRPDDYTVEAGARLDTGMAAPADIAASAAGGTGAIRIRALSAESPTWHSPRAGA
ncbi:MAG: hypothetical protein U5K76_10165 [Woeseiaceae bacterium]|nr:hypothetical protein [Woeseiaceae bacterium]